MKKEGDAVSWELHCAARRRAGRAALAGGNPSLQDRFHFLLEFISLALLSKYFSIPVLHIGGCSDADVTPRSLTRGAQSAQTKGSCVQGWSVLW